MQDKFGEAAKGYILFWAWILSADASRGFFGVFCVGLQLNLI